ncbi:MAG: hypothetical protein RL757_218 [Bacteroidota bacterium]|jgi:hypothetical protein
MFPAPRSWKKIKKGFNGLDIAINRVLKIIIFFAQN